MNESTVGLVAVAVSCLLALAYRRMRRLAVAQRTARQEAMEQLHRSLAEKPRRGPPRGAGEREDAVRSAADLLLLQEDPRRRGILGAARRLPVDREDSHPPFSFSIRSLC
jgi:hypothetical protein